ARAAGPLPAGPGAPVFDPDLAGRYRGLRVAIARDEAFWFYYPDALAWVEFLGVELLPFSPLHDAQMPDNAHGIWIGGGFPERHAPALAANQAMIEQVRGAWRRGVPFYAECGGFQYLLEELVTDQPHAMAGCLQGSSTMHSRLQGLGYRQADPAAPGAGAAASGAAAPDGAAAGDGGERGDGHRAPGPNTVRGHVFHYSRAEGIDGQRAWSLYRATGDFERHDGVITDTALASYLHLHFPTQPGVAAEFLDRCRAYADRTGDAAPSGRRGSGRDDGEPS
ncbi:MAG: hypothetical protein WD535_05260, partial [Thermaerobacterales bacterium]